jgi:hypothetical protein
MKNTRTDLGTARATWKRAATWLVALAGALALATTAWAQKGGKPGGGGGGGFCVSAMLAATHHSNGKTQESLC